MVGHCTSGCLFQKSENVSVLNVVQAVSGTLAFAAAGATWDTCAPASSCGCPRRAVRPPARGQNAQPVSGARRDGEKQERGSPVRGVWAGTPAWPVSPAAQGQVPPAGRAVWRGSPAPPPSCHWVRSQQRPTWAELLGVGLVPRGLPPWPTLLCAPVVFPRHPSLVSHPRTPALWGGATQSSFLTESPS